jgi:hypothetical protein
VETRVLGNVAIDRKFVFFVTSQLLADETAEVAHENG